MMPGFINPLEGRFRHVSDIPNAGAPEMAAHALRLSGDWPHAGIGSERTLIDRRQHPGLISPSCKAPFFASTQSRTISEDAKTSVPSAQSF